MIDFDDEMLFYRDQKQIFSDIEGEIVMLNIKNEEYYSLNEAASIIWKLLEKPIKLESLVSSLLDIYDVDHNQCLNETKHYINELHELGIINVQEASK